MHNLSKLSWDDWKLVIAVAKAGSTGRAAELLGINQSTVFRRIHHLEHALGAQLFDKDRSGYTLTPLAESILPKIKEMSGLTHDIERSLLGADRDPVGTVTISLGQSIAFIIMDGLADFLRVNPRIKIIINASTQLVSLRDREADIVVRGSNDPDPALFGRRVMTVRYAIYMNSAIARKKKIQQISPGEYDQFQWIVPALSLANTDVGAWNRKHDLVDSAVLLVDDVEIGCAAVEKGIGVAVLPTFIADRKSKIRRISEELPGLKTDLWVLSHEDQRNTARISLLRSALSEYLRFDNRQINEKY